MAAPTATKPPTMIARISPSPNQLAAACFPVAGCTVAGYATKTGYKLFISPPQPWAGPAVYGGHGATCYDALAAAVQLFHDTAHAYPAAQPLAAAGSYCPPLGAAAKPFPDDEPAPAWVRCEDCVGDGCQWVLRRDGGEQPGPPCPKCQGRGEVPATTCPKCGGSGTNHHELYEASKWIHGGDSHECYECEGLGRVAA